MFQDCEPCPPPHPAPPKSDDLVLPVLLVLAVLFGGFYFVIKAGVKAALAEFISELKLPSKCSV